MPFQSDPNALHLLAIGDFGTGGQDQKNVAEAMQAFVAKQQIKPEGMWMIGDNAYGATYAEVSEEAKKLAEEKKKAEKKTKDKNKKQEKDDRIPEFTVKSKRWKEQIEDMYPASVFPGPQWAVLGNHDYHDNVGGEEVQLAYAKQPGVRWHMPNKWYRVDLKKDGKPLVTFLALDSNLPGVSSGKHRKTGRILNHLKEEEEAAQLAWLKDELAKPRAPFTVVVAHHPLYSNGSHKDTKKIISQWGDLLQEHKVHAYLCGHDHDMQHLELEGKFTSFVLSGGGGARIRALAIKDRKIPYGKDINGFTHLQILPDALTITHLGVDGGVLHRFTKKLDGSVIFG